MSPGRAPGVTFTRWEVTEADRQAIAHVIGQKRPVTLTQAEAFLRERGEAGLRNAHAMQLIQSETRELLTR